MKKNLFFFGLLLVQSVVSVNAQPTTIPFNPAASLSASSLYTNDEEHMTVLEAIACACDGVYYVPSIHLNTSSITISNYTFQPGFTYTVQISGSGTASGDLANPAASNIYFGASVGAPSYSNDLSSTDGPFPDYQTLVAASHLQAYNGPGWEGYGTVGLTLTFLTNLVGVGHFPNSATVSSSTSFSFTVPATITGLNIEAYPVLGDQAIYVTGGYGITNPTNPPTPPTNTTLTIDNVTISASCAPPPVPGITIRGIEPLNHGTQMDVTVSTSAPAPYLWYVNGVLAATTYTSTPTINGGSNCNITNTLTVQVSTGCGSSSASTTYRRPCSSAMAVFSVSPNPAYGIVTISAPAEATEQTGLIAKTFIPESNKIYQLRVIDKFGNVRKTFRYPTGVSTLTIDLSSLGSDVYTVQVYNNHSWISKPLLLIK